MSSNTFFISVMDGATSNGGLTVNIETEIFSTSTETTQSEAVSASFNITGITNGMTEYEIATQISNQLGAALKLQDLNYLGELAYSEEEYPATFQITKTDHIVCIWSQSLFTVSVSNNTCSAKFCVKPKPNLISLNESQNKAFQVRFNLKDGSGVALTDDQIIDLTYGASSFLTTLFRNNIVRCTYAKELRGNDTNAIKLYPRPVVDFDMPRVRRRDSINSFDTLSWGKDAYFIGHDRGSLVFRHSEHIVDEKEPFYIQNMVYLSFIAGENHIPEEIKLGILDLSRYKIQVSGEIKSMKGGTAAFEFFPASEGLTGILLPLKIYKMR